MTAQMYRHFATVTVAITALVAFFANGEKQQALAARRPAIRSQTMQPEVPSRHLQQWQNEDAVDPATWGSDDGSFGQPMIVASDDRSGFSRPIPPNSEPRSNAQNEAPPTDPGNSDELVGSGSPPSPTASQVAAVAAASRSRSGASGRD